MGTRSAISTLSGDALFLLTLNMMAEMRSRLGAFRLNTVDELGLIVLDYLQLMGSGSDNRVLGSMSLK